MKKIEVRPNGSRRVYTVNNLPSKTDQSFKKECDVNEIMRKYLKTGQMAHLRGMQGTYADVSEIGDLQECVQKVQLAQEAFNSLPATLRNKLNNDPSKFIEYLNDPKNVDEAVELGLMVRKNTGTTREESSGSKPDVGRARPEAKSSKSKLKPQNDDELNDDE